MPTEQDLSVFYQQGYYQSWGSGADELSRRAREKRQTFSRWLNFLPQRPPGRLLDIGCAFGFLLDSAEKAGWEAHGLEISPEGLAAAAARHPGRITKGTVFDAEFPAGWFSVITMCDVLEHLPEPEAVLRRVHSLLQPCGSLLISTPAADSMSRKLLGRFWPQFKPEHPILHSARGLDLLLARSGFRREFQTTAWKYLSPAFLADYFRHFPVPIFSQVLAGLRWLLPDALAEMALPLAGGEILVVARRL